MLALANPSVIATVISATMTREGARAALFKAGWKYLDGGSFSSVWLAPDGSRVVKVTKEDAGSRATIAAAFATNTPHLPRCYGTVELANGGFAAEVEVLDSASYDEYRQHNPNLRRLREADDAEQPQLSAAFAALRQYVDDVTVDWDIHSGNIMFRDEADGSRTLVLTDVLYWCKYQFNGTKHDAATVAQSCADDPIEQLMQPTYDAVAA